MRCSFVPDFLLERLREADDEHCSRCADRTLRRDRVIRAARSVRGIRTPSATATGVAWQIYDADHGTDLPGTLLRSPGEPATGDVAADEAADGIAAALAMYAEVYDRDSFDDHGAEVRGSVHYDQNYDNAFWNGIQLVFGDGDGTVFGRFTRPVDVLGHELTHAVTERTAGLTYQGQPGALNESISDVFGISLKQRLLGESADEADWLIGEGIFLPGVKGVALRSMKAPGTAFDDPRLGKDPQVGDLADYVETSEDDGGVHTNSGIPNRAFYLAATAIGGSTAEGAGRVWYAALTSGIGADTDFAGFATACVDAAGRHADAVRSAWRTVGITPS